VSTSHYDKTTIIRAVLDQVDQSLQASEAWSLGILILMRPGLVCRSIFVVWPLDVDNVKGHDEVFGVVDPAGKE
jgi:hypothetical protein